MFEVFRSRSASASTNSLDRTTHPTTPASPHRRGRSALSSRIKLGLAKHFITLSSTTKEKTPAKPPIPSGAHEKPRISEVKKVVPGGEAVQPPNIFRDLESRQTRARSDSTPPPVHNRLSLAQIVFSPTQQSPLSPPGRPARNPARVGAGKRPSTASGLLESRPHSKDPTGRKQSRINKSGSFDMSRPTTSHTVVAEPLTFAPPNLSQARFSTADRTILEELKYNISARDAQFTTKGPYGKKHHPYAPSVAPYPRNYERIILDHDVWETEFSMNLGRSVTFHQIDQSPCKVLDIGCGTGVWIMHCAKVWKDTFFVGLDLVPLQPDLRRLGSTDLSQRISWVQANFLEGIPFPNEEFDFVHIQRIAAGVPEDKWDGLFEEVLRVMKPGAAIEVIEEDLYIPGSITDPLSSGSTSSLATRSPGSLLPSTGFSSSTVNLNDSTSSANLSTSTLASSGNPIINTSSLPKQPLSRVRSLHRSGPQSPTMISPPSNLTIRPRASSGTTTDDNNAFRDENTSLDVATPLPSASLFSNWNGSQTHLSLPTSIKNLQSTPADTNDITLRVHMHKPSLSALRTSKLGNVGRHAFENLSGRTPGGFSPAGNVLSSTAAYLGSLLSSHADTSRDVRPDMFAKAAKEHDRERVLYHPSPRLNLLENPRDHVLLETLYKEMYASRFINLSPLSLLTNLLGIYFTHLRSHAPVSLSFPPVNNKMPDISDEDDSDTWSESDLDSLSSKGDDDAYNISQEKFDTSTVEVTDSIQDFDAKRAMHRQNRRKSASMYSAQQYIMMDDARAPAVIPRVQRSLTSLNSLARNSAGTSTSYNSIEKESHVHKIHVSIQGEKMMRSSTLPNQSLAFDPKTLNVHLSARVQEVLACSEAMWEWVTEYQAEERARPRQYTKDGTPIDVHAHMTRNARQNGDDVRIWDAIATMTRDDFDMRLSWFEMDMQDHIGLGAALEKNLGWRGVNILKQSKSSERRTFEAACRRWDVQAQQHRHNHVDTPYTGDAQRRTSSQVRGNRSNDVSSSLNELSDQQYIEDEIQFAERRDSIDTSAASSSEYGFELTPEGRLTPTFNGDNGSGSFEDKGKQRMPIYQDGVDADLLESLAGEDSVPLEAISVPEKLVHTDIFSNFAPISPESSDDENADFSNVPLFYEGSLTSTNNTKSVSTRHSSASPSHSLLGKKNSGRHRRKSRIDENILEPKPIKLSRTYRVWAAWKAK